MRTAILACLILLALARPAFAEDATDDRGAPESTGQMKAVGGFINMEPQTDYEAPDDARDPASDEGGD